MVSNFAPICGLASSTLALGITAPLESVTTPVTSPRCVCAHAVGMNSSRTISAGEMQKERLQPSRNLAAGTRWSGVSIVAPPLVCGFGDDTYNAESCQENSWCIMPQFAVI